MKCVFFGSPDFAVPFLNALVDSKNHSVVGVITQPDRPAKRGLSLEPPPVKVVAGRLGLPILQPEKVNSDTVIDWIKGVRAEILVVVAYGEFLGKKLLNLCPTPPINVHPSLLPKLRGAAPVQWAVINGLRRTGVSVQFMSPKMDAGDIIAQATIEIGANETAEDLFKKVEPVGTKLLLSALDAIGDGTVNPKAQDDSQASFAPLLTKADGLVLWEKWTAAECHNRIRGLYPWPAAYTRFQAKRIKILKSRIPQNADWGNSAQPGEFVVNGDHLLVRCRDGALELLTVQPEGKRPMLPREFVNGIQRQQPSYAFDGAEPER